MNTTHNIFTTQKPLIINEINCKTLYVLPGTQTYVMFINNELCLQRIYLIQQRFQWSIHVQLSWNSRTLCLVGFVSQYATGSCPTDLINHNPPCKTTPQSLRTKSNTMNVMHEWNVYLLTHVSLILLFLVAAAKELSKITFDPLSGANTTNTHSHIGSMVASYSGGCGNFQDALVSERR